jgi:dUTP pyrophosphatase
MILKVFCSDNKSKIPYRASKGAAGFDLCSNDNFTIQPGNRMLISTGLIIQIPEGCYGRIAPRSGLSTKGIDVGAGVIDEDYLGEIKVLLINNSLLEFKIMTGDRIAQLLIEKVFYPEIVVLDNKDDFTKTERGEGGFGSTGIN